jgi:hypothetical protein
MDDAELLCTFEREIIARKHRIVVREPQGDFLTRYSIAMKEPPVILNFTVSHDIVHGNARGIADRLEREARGFAATHPRP